MGIRKSYGKNKKSKRAAAATEVARAAIRRGGSKAPSKEMGSRVRS